ncbi:hypothetical protein [Providencia hangzhouensis]|uniref:hypothetical protein n=1 Tax=Providencia hangzhouensis TaxID=3031799 RepID=UPI003F4B3043
MKKALCAIGIILYLCIFWGFSFFISIDNSCKMDKPSLEKRCVRAIEHYRGQ